jgi:predicted PurR-regulated permease PerM
MHPTMVQRAFFGALLFLVTLAFLWLIRGFLQPIFWAIALGIVIYPVHWRLENRFGHRSSLAAFASMLLIVLIVLLPLAGVITAITTEAATLYQRLEAGDFQLDRIYREIQLHLPQLVSALDAIGINPERLQAQFSAAAVGVSRFLASRALAIGQNTLRIAVFFFLMLYLLFFFLRDGTRLLESVVRALPLGDARERQLLARFAEVSRATIKGTLVIGLAQGTIGGIAFWALGISAPVLWGAVMALMSILPAIGPAVVWVPAAVVLIANGHIAAGIVLIVVGMFVIGLADNLLRPILVGRDTRMPDYLVLLSTLGGLTAFGLAGIVIGPIIAAFFLSCWHMAREEFGEDGDETVAADGEHGVNRALGGREEPRSSGEPAALEVEREDLEDETDAGPAKLDRWS